MISTPTPRRVGGLQILYLPWLGVFHQIASCDAYFFADDVQYTKQNWINRNRIVGHGGGFTWLTVPVHREGLHSTIRDVRIANEQDWRRKHLRSISSRYRGAPFFETIYPPLEAIVARPCRLLVDLNLDLLRFVLDLLAIDTPIRLRSELHLPSGRDESIIEACRLHGANVYYSGVAGARYLKEELFRDAGIRIEYQRFLHPVYPQMGGGEFETHLSVVDALFMLGPARCREEIDAQRP